MRFWRHVKPIIILHTAVSGNPKAYSVNKENYGDGWWNRHFGDSKLFDLNKFCVICFSHFGGNGPSSTADELELYKEHISILDTCYLAAKALIKLDIRKVHAVIGVSMGAAIAREWIFQEMVKVNKVVEIFGNFGNNHIGLQAKDYVHIQIDLLQSTGNDLSGIQTRLIGNCGSMCAESRGYEIAYNYILSEFSALHTEFSEHKVLRVARMVGFLRFVTPHYFQQKWDEFFCEGQNEYYATEQLQNLCSHLGDEFVRTFKKSALCQLRRMDAKPEPVHPKSIADKLSSKSIDLMGLIVRGDRLYDSNLQFEYYRKLQDNLPKSVDCNVGVKIHICHNHIRGHDHFLSEEFLADAKEISAFLKL